MSSPGLYVFGYGSLVDYIGKPGVRLASLNGCRRKWNVAMDNSKIIPGYKYYVDPVTRTRPPVCVTFLNISLEEPESSSVNGLIVPVDEKRINLLDNREWNYDRVEVTDRIDSLPAGARVFCYYGKAEARLRFDRAVISKTAVIPKIYREIVETGFMQMGPGQFDNYLSTTDKHGLNYMDLEFVKPESRELSSNR